MTGSTKALRHLKQLSRKKIATTRRRQRYIKRWRDKMTNFELLTNNILNNKGNKRSKEEKKLILLVIKSTLKREIAQATTSLSDYNVFWTKIDCLVSNDLHIKR